MGYLATALLLYSIWYGFARVNCRNFEPADGPRADACETQQAPKSNAPPPPIDEEKRLAGVGFQKAVLIMFWVLMPPVWFSLEYFGIWRYEDKTVRQGIEDLKVGQELAAKIWLAAVTALGTLYFGKDIRGGG